MKFPADACVPTDSCAAPAKKPSSLEDDPKPTFACSPIHCDPTADDEGCGDDMNCVQDGPTDLKNTCVASDVCGTTPAKADGTDGDTEVTCGAYTLAVTLAAAIGIAASM
jgi:hypothetical protein